VDNHFNLKRGLLAQTVESGGVGRSRRIHCGDEDAIIALRTTGELPGSGNGVLSITRRRQKVWEYKRASPCASIRDRVLLTFKKRWIRRDVRVSLDRVAEVAWVFPKMVGGKGGLYRKSQTSRSTEADTATTHGEVRGRMSRREHLSLFPWDCASDGHRAKQKTGRRERRERRSTLLGPKSLMVERKKLRN